MKEGEDSTLMTRKKILIAPHPHYQNNSSPYVVNGESSNITFNKKVFKCYRCDKTSHIKISYQARLQENNVTDKIVEEEN